MGGLPRRGVPYGQVVGILWRRFGTVLGGIFRGLARYLPGGMGIPSHRQGMLCPEDMLVQDFFMSSPSGGAWGVLHGSVQVPETVAYVASVFFPGVKEVCAHAPLRASIVALNAERDIFVPAGTQYPGEVADLFFLSGVYGHAAYFLVEDAYVRGALRSWGDRIRELAS